MIAQAKAAAAARAKALAPSTTKQAAAKNAVPPQAAHRKPFQGKPPQPQRPAVRRTTTAATAVKPSGTAQPSASAIAGAVPKPGHSDPQSRPALNATETNGAAGEAHNDNASTQPAGPVAALTTENACNSSEKIQASTRQTGPNVDATSTGQFSTATANGETTQATGDATDVKMSTEKQVKIEESSAEHSQAESTDGVNKSAITADQERLKVERSRESAAVTPAIKEEDSKIEATSASPVIKEEEDFTDPAPDQAETAQQVKQEEPRTEIVSKGSSNSPVSDKATAEPLQVQ